MRVEVFLAVLSCESPIDVLVFPKIRRFIGETFAVVRGTSGAIVFLSI